jgi:hypothetical protein
MRWSGPGQLAGGAPPARRESFRQRRAGTASRGPLNADVRHAMTNTPEFNLRLPLLLSALTAITACSAASPLAMSFPNSDYSTEKVTRGVVNGLWEHDTDRNRARLKSLFAGADESLATELSSRYLVRVGINRSYLFGSFSEFVALPDGWVYSMDAVVNDGRTINVGDVVDIRGHIGTNLESVVAIVRKCDAQPVPGENKDWSIGCRRIEAFDSSGFGGTKYWLSVF